MSSTAESFRPDRVDRVGWVVGLAWPERVARRVPPGSYLLASGTRAGLVGGSDEWIAVAEVTRAEGRNAAGTGAVIRSAAGLSEEAALDAAGGLLVEETTARFVGEKLSARRVRRLGAIELSSTPVKADKAAGRAAVAARLAEEGLGSLPWDEPARALRHRLGFLHRELGAPWPRMGDAALAEDAESWLGPELGILAEGKRLPKGALASALRRLLPWPEASRLDELAPERLRVPSGNTAAIEYPEPDEDGQPVVSVKLQECFGFTGTPRLADGRAPVLFHLLSPARHPLAVTDDLASFWSGPYAQVRAEMRGRYPKHPWPENPLEATATHLTNRRLRERG